MQSCGIDSHQNMTVIPPMETIDEGSLCWSYFSVVSKWWILVQAQLSFMEALLSPDTCSGTNTAGPPANIPPLRKQNELPRRPNKTLLLQRNHSEQINPLTYCCLLICAWFLCGSACVYVRVCAPVPVFMSAPDNYKLDPIGLAGLLPVKAWEPSEDKNWQLLFKNMVQLPPTYTHAHTHTSPRDPSSEAC